MALPALPVLSMHEWVTRHIVQDAVATVGVRIQRVRALCQLGLPSQAVQLLSMLLKVQCTVAACVQGCAGALSAMGLWLLWVAALSKPCSCSDCISKVNGFVKSPILVLFGVKQGKTWQAVLSEASLVQEVYTLKGRPCCCSMCVPICPGCKRPGGSVRHPCCSSTQHTVTGPPLLMSASLST